MVADIPRKKRIFITSAHADDLPVRRAVENLELDAVTLEQAATPGTSWVESLHRCVTDADAVIGIMGDRRRDSNVFFELGVARVILGTQALAQPGWFAEVARAFPGKVLLGLDARAGRVATHGWELDSDCQAVDLARRMAELPLAGLAAVAAAALLLFLNSALSAVVSVVCG